MSRNSKEDPSKGNTGVERHFASRPNLSASYCVREGLQSGEEYTRCRGEERCRMASARSKEVLEVELARARARAPAGEASL
jgi:hypothetical protein